MQLYLDTLGLSEEQFLHFCERNRKARMELTADQELLIFNTLSLHTAGMASDIVLSLSAYAKAVGGKVWHSSVGYRLPNRAVRCAKASYITPEMWGVVQAAPQDDFLPFAPHFLIELRDSQEPMWYYEAKMQEWIGNGARLAWLIDPSEEKAYIYRPGQPAPEVVTGFHNSLSGEDVLPGFTLALAELR